MHVRASVVGRLDESVNNHDAGSQSARRRATSSKFRGTASARAA
jgi:hypothetical protein